MKEQKKKALEIKGPPKSIQKMFCFCLSKVFVILGFFYFQGFGDSSNIVFCLLVFPRFSDA